MNAQISTWKEAKSALEIPGLVLEEDEDASQPPDNDNPHNDPLILIIENIMAT